jgi:IS30 family transposase
VAKRFWKLSDELRREVIRLAAEHKTQREIVELTGVTKGSVWRVLRPRGGVSRTEDRMAGCPGRLSLDERVRIAVGLGMGESFTTIAAAIGRNVSTISREVGGRAGRASYRAEVAHRMAWARRARPKVTKLARNPQLCQRVIEDLERWYSPQQIACRLRREFPDEPEMWVSHETIYKSLFVQGRGELRKELATCLRTGRAIRRSRAMTRPRDGAIREPVSISERPAEADDRAVPGHWEGDLIIGARGKSAIGTLVERTTRYVMLLHLGEGYNAEAVRDAMTAKIQTLPETLRRSITWDRGTEMARHREFTTDTGIQIYFCDPHSPWQRGTNENTNGLLRQYLPKGTDLSVHNAQDLDAIADSLNDRPRKTLDWQKPTEALDAILATTG